MKFLGDPAFPYWEWQYLKTIHMILTEHWQLLQQGTSVEATDMWRNVFSILELDRKAQRGMFLLIHSGVVGRTYANRILWDLLSGPALDPEYQDLSCMTTNKVYAARKLFDRPPRENEDLRWWRWEHLTCLHEGDLPWSPQAGPNRMVPLCVGPGGLPYPPPRCWQHEKGSWF